MSSASVTSPADQTPLMGEQERHAAEQLSMQEQSVPLRVPGYEQEQFLGRGTFGEVWVAVDCNTGRKAAIKFYHRRGGLDWSLLSREVEKLRHLFSDRYVVQLLGVGWDADPPYYVMEYMERGSLEDRLRSAPITVAEAVSFAREVAVGLMHAHGKGILHCDLKPANIMLDQDDKPRLADFGQSRLSTEHSPALGTLFYMAPEQADLKSIPDVRWDVYALGALLYRMLTGEPPHRTEAGVAEILEPNRLEERLERYRRFLRSSPLPQAHRRVPGVDAALVHIIDRCLAINPHDRYRNVQEVLHALDSRGMKRARRPLLVLGAVAPVLVLLMMGWIGRSMLGRTLGVSREALTQRALESDGFAAQSVADQFALEVDRRWRILEREAADPHMRASLEALFRLGVDSDEGRTMQERLQQWLEERNHALDRQFTPATRATGWFLNDRAGFQVARSPMDAAVLNKNWAFRDYFHGQGNDLDPKSPVRPTPLKSPHRSAVYRSQSTNTLMVAFSVPIRADDSESSDPIGVLAMAVDLGHFAELQGTRSQFAAMIDMRADATGRKGRFVEHPQLARQQKPGASRGFDFYVAPEVVSLAERLSRRKQDSLSERMNGEADKRSDAAVPESVEGEHPFLSDYLDPVVNDPTKRWLAAFEPVVVARGRDQVVETGWVVVVQEPQEATLQPLSQLGGQLVRAGLVGLGLVLAVVAALWAFVLLVLDPSGDSRLTRFLRRSVGLPSSSSASTGSSSAASRSGSVSTGSSVASGSSVSPGSVAESRDEKHGEPSK